jgi:hypothetical protein
MVGSAPAEPQRFESFWDFYPFYLGEGQLGDVCGDRLGPPAVLTAGYRIMSASALRIDVLGMPNRPP